jgi:putative DNA primase/helicase
MTERVEPDEIKLTEEEAQEILRVGTKTIKIKLDNYQENTELFYKAIPFFYDDVGIFWVWNGEEHKYTIVDETDIMNLFDCTLGFEGQTISRGIKSNYIEAFKRVGRAHKPKDAKIKWIQFRDTAYDLKGHTHRVNHKYFFTNPIPYSLSERPETPVMDKLFTDWVGEEQKQTLYEIIAYCCYRDYPIQSIFCLYGTGRNGKSKFLGIIKKFLGLKNICSSELDILSESRFEAFKLYKKLACFMGETNSGVMTNTSMLKRLVGGDLIGYEMKGKTPFDEVNYAKIIIASNSLPSSSDTTDGFFRRWNIIKFENEFPEGKDILSIIPEQEYSNLAKKVTQILPILLERGMFTNQGSIEERKSNYLMASNPLPIFIKEYCIAGDEKYCSYSRLYTEYVKFIHNNKRRRVTLGEFRHALEDEGFYIERTSKKSENGEFISGNWVIGVELNELCKVCNYVTLSIRKSIPIERVESDTYLHNLHKSDIPFALLEWSDKLIVYQKCSITNCTNHECNLDTNLVPYCTKHFYQNAIRY